jgi:transposase
VCQAPPTTPSTSACGTGAHPSDLGCPVTPTMQNHPPQAAHTGLDHHPPGDERSGRGLRRWPTADLRPGRLQAAQRRQALLQPLKQYRAIATRYDKSALSYQGMIDLATLRMWL